MTKGDKERLVVLSHDKAVILKLVLKEKGIEAVICDEHQPQAFLLSEVLVEKDKLAEAVKTLDSFLSISRKVAVAEQESSVVLVPVDFSPYSEKACEVAFRYAAANDLCAVLLHTYISDSYRETLPPGIKIISEKIKRDKPEQKELKAIQLMSGFCDGLKSKMRAGLLPRVDFVSKVLQGIPEAVIVEYAREIKPTIIVMGTRGKHQKEEDLIGSVTAEVLDATEHPLLIIPDGLEPHDLVPVRNVMIYCLLEQTDIETVSLYLSKIASSDCAIKLAHIRGKREKLSEERLEAFRKFCEKNFPDNRYETVLFDDEDFLDDFNKCLIDNEIKLLVLPNRKRNIFTRLFNPSIAHRLFFHTDTAMVILPTFLA